MAVTKAMVFSVIACVPSSCVWNLRNVRVKMWELKGGGKKIKEIFYSLAAHGNNHLLSCLIIITTFLVAIRSGVTLLIVHIV